MKSRQKIWQPETAAYKRFHFPVHARSHESHIPENEAPPESDLPFSSAQPEVTDKVTADALVPESQNHYSKGFMNGEQEGYRKGLEEGRRASLEEGKKIGLEQGRIMLSDQQKNFVNTLQEQLEKVQSSHLKHREELTLWLGRVVEETCRQVVRRELSTESDQIIRVIKETLELMPENKQCSIHLNPQDADLLKTLKPDLGIAWQIIEDRSVAEGDCRIVSSETEAEARLESRLVECLDIIRESLPASIKEVG